MLLWSLIRKWYDKMSPRERIMLLAFIWVIVLGWFGVVSRQLKTLRDNVHSVQHDLEKQTIVLSQEQTIKINLQQMLGRFDKANVVNANQLFQTVAEFAKDSNLDNPQIAQQRVNQTADIFKINTVVVHFSHASIHDLVDFASKIEERNPYLAIDDISITPNPIRPDQLDASMRVSSLELNQTDLPH
jgi:Tfp pilus assembly protein PilO